MGLVSQMHSLKYLPRPSPYMGACGGHTIDHTPYTALGVAGRMIRMMTILATFRPGPTESSRPSTAIHRPLYSCDHHYLAIIGARDRKRVPCTLTRVVYHATHVPLPSIPEDELVVVDLIYIALACFVHMRQDYYQQSDLSMMSMTATLTTFR
jgi:hypothetical protein